MRPWCQSLKMELEMAKELENFLSSLEPKWEDPNEFEWLRKIRIPSLGKKTKYIPSNRTNY